jgi:hypothetical protein
MYVGRKSPQYKIPDAVSHFQGFPRFIYGRLYELGITNAHCVYGEVLSGRVECPEGFVYRHTHRSTR